MSFISQFRKSDQEYILKAYPLALKVAVKNGHTDFIKELTDYFSQIVSDGHTLFKEVKTEAIIKVKSLYDPPKNREEVLKTLESLKYEPHQQQDVIIDVTEALITTAPEPSSQYKRSPPNVPPLLIFLILKNQQLIRSET